MNTNKLLMMATLLVGSTALAQNQPVTMSTQIDMSRDYAQSILTKIGTGGAARFNDSTDFSKIGPQLKTKMEQALTDFREGLSYMILPTFSQAVDRYNEIVNDKNLSATEKTERLNQARTVLNQQLTATSSVYGSEIRKLYHIAPSLIMLDVYASGRETYAKFEDGSSALFNKNEKARYADNVSSGWRVLIADRSRLSQDNNNHMLSPGLYPTWIYHYLSSVCQTRICYAGVLSMLVDYISQVDSFINRAIVVPLADGESIKIEGLSAVPDSLPEFWLALGLTHFAFGQNFSQLPLRN